MAKQIGYGSVLVYVSSTGDINLGQVRNVDGPDGSATDVDTTTLDSSSNFRTYARAPVDPGSLTFSIVYDPSLDSHQRLGSRYRNGLASSWKVYHGSSTGDEDAFVGYVQSLSRAIPLDDVISCDVGLKVSGLPGYTTTTG